MTGLGPALDAARARVVERGLMPDAVTQLTEVVRTLPPEALAPVKQLVKRFFSAQPWTAADDDALADVVGPGAGGSRRELAPGLTLVWGWDANRFRLRVHGDPDPSTLRGAVGTDLGETFDGVVQPEVTPSPRTLRFATPRLHSGASRVYEAETAATDPRVGRLFDEFDDVTNVLVGPEFVAVTISHADRWESLLAPMLRAVTREFTAAPDAGGVGTQPEGGPASAGSGSNEENAVAAREPRRLERAWAELGALRADRHDDLERILAASRADDPARRQVAGALLVEAPLEIAVPAWDQLLHDPNRMVRRAVVDAVAGTEREEGRPLLERALHDADAWTRWKALRGITALGVGSSRAAIAACAGDTDFRVRLEAARALEDARD